MLPSRGWRADVVGLRVVPAVGLMCIDVLSLLALLQHGSECSESALSVARTGTGMGSLSEQAGIAFEEALALEKEAARRRELARELEERAKQEQLQVWIPTVARPVSLVLSINPREALPCCMRTQLALVVGEGGHVCAASWLAAFRVACCAHLCEQQ